RAPRSPLFPYTTLFRSAAAVLIDAIETEPQLVLHDRTAKIDGAAIEIVAARARVERIIRLLGGLLGHDVDSAARLEPAVERRGRSEEHTSELQSRENLV